MSEERLTVAAEPRTIKGKKVKQLRREGFIPAVIYGQKDPMTIQFEERPLYRVLKKASTTNLVDIELDGETRTVIARDIQQHLTRGDLIHVDFFEVDMQKTITTEASLVMVGLSSGGLESMGSVVLATQSVTIECLPGDLISEIEVNISGIESPDDLIFVADLSVPDSIAVLTDGETVVARFEYVQTEEEVEEEEVEYTSVESVEVIEKGKIEEEEE
ncbi:MAG: 50S ribosomal protein L25 [Chloroflexi bacterium]|nr:50S ribosomal protein L25 [Chloroflexota bacterium]